MSIDPVTLAAELIRFPTINPPGNEADAVRHLGRLLERAGFACREIPMGEGRINLIARIEGRGSRPPIAFTGHLDVVPLGAQPWTVDPFGAEVKDGRIYGRGACDMKSGVAAFVTAAVAAADNIGAGPGVTLVLTAGEETGCDGAHYIVAHARAALGEAGALVVAEPTSNLPMVGHKGALRLKVTARGVTAHGSMPEKGVNAVAKAARAVMRLEDFDFNFARHPMMGAATLNVGWLHGGININSVPDRAEIGLDIRTLPGQSHRDIEAGLAAFLGPEVEISRLDENVSVWTEPTHPWIERVVAISGDVLGRGVTAAAAPYFTDASALTLAYGGLPTVILGPGPAALAHQTDEYCEIERIGEAVEIYRRLIDDWCGS